MIRPHEGAFNYVYIFNVTSKEGDRMDTGTRNESKTFFSKLLLLRYHSHTIKLPILINLFTKHFLHSIYFHLQPEETNDLLSFTIVLPLLEFHIHLIN